MELLTPDVYVLSFIRSYRPVTHLSPVRMKLLKRKRTARKTLCTLNVPTLERFDFRFRVTFKEKGTHL